MCWTVSLVIYLYRVGWLMIFFFSSRFFRAVFFFFKYVTPNRPHQAPAASVQYGPSALEREWFRVLTRDHNKFSHTLNPVESGVQISFAWSSVETAEEVSWNSANSVHKLLLPNMGSVVKLQLVHLFSSLRKQLWGRRRDRRKHNGQKKKKKKLAVRLRKENLREA